MRKEIRFSSLKESSEYDQKGLSFWIKDGRPDVWVKVESLLSEDVLYEVEVNVAYGGIRLLQDNDVVSSGKYEAISDTMIALDKEYYGLSKYLWR